MNIRDLKLNSRLGLEGLVIHGVDSFLHFAELLLEDLEKDWTHGDTVPERLLFIVEEMIQRLKDMKDCLRGFEAERTSVNGRVIRA